MGRGKIEIKRIENAKNQQVTYSKRRNGLVKKAKEISVLCDAKVSLLIFNSSGKMHEYCTPNSELIKILDAYQKQSGNRLWDAKHESLSNEIERIKKENDSMQIELRHLNGDDITSLHHKELMSIEDALENGLTCLRERQMEIYKLAKKNASKIPPKNSPPGSDPLPTLSWIRNNENWTTFADKEMILEDENKRLNYQMHHQMMDMEGGEMENEYHYQPQMPNFSFRVQPIQPNLHDQF